MVEKILKNIFCLDFGQKYFMSVGARSSGLYLYYFFFCSDVITLILDKEFRLGVQKNIHVISLCSDNTVVVLFSLSQY